MDHAADSGAVRQQLQPLGNPPARGRARGSFCEELLTSGGAA